MKVGLIGSPEREELQRLALRLEERDSEGVFLDVRADARLSWSPTSASACGVDLNRLQAFYIADLGLKPSHAGPGASAAAHANALRESQRHLAAWTALLTQLSTRARVVNPPHTWDLHGLKPFETAAYHRAGLTVPSTLATNDVEELAGLKTATVHAGGRIVKGLVGGYGYTERFEAPSDVESARAALARGPLLVQERIVGDNVRAFVCDGKIVGAGEIVPASGAEVDSRRETGRVKRISLPAAAEHAALAAAKRFELPFAAVDFMREDKTGRWVLLECNSAPFFVAFERVTGVAVSSALADLLTARLKKPADAR